MVQKTDTGKIYAMKTMKKEEMLKNEQVPQFLTAEEHALKVLP